jgi:catechol 2,3-dioxygenase-like lactoylglutathione lyase family enzyme
MPMPTFRQVNPILGTRDIERAIAFYVDRLGFTLKFRDGATPTNYVGFLRGGVELHMQFQYPHEMGTIRLRILVDDPDALYDEYRDKDVFYDGTQLRDTPWGTREFALYDPDRNALTFYANLKSAGQT